MVVATCAEAYARTEVSHKRGVDAPQRIVQHEDNGITVAYTFAGNAPSACNAGDGGCVWRIEGFGLRDAPGGYATPFRVDAFSPCPKAARRWWKPWIRRSLTMIAASLRRGVFPKKALRQRVW